MSPLDSFSEKFDSIELDRARAPSAEAIARATAFASEEPGFYLLDDAGGRFIVDREMGVVSLKDEAVLAREFGAVHVARLRVVERSGARYELELRLRLTGMVPQMVDAEDLADATDAPPQPARAWVEFAAAAPQDRCVARLPEYGPYGALIAAAPVQPSAQSAQLHLSAPAPPPSPAGAVWPV